MKANFEHFYKRITQRDSKTCHKPVAASMELAAVPAAVEQHLRVGLRDVDLAALAEPWA